MEYKSISKSISLISLFTTHKDNGGAFYPKFSKNLTDIMLKCIDFFFLKLIINENQIDSDGLSEFISPKVLSNLILMLFKEGE